jgi:hypothetical protein
MGDVALPADHQLDDAVAVAQRRASELDPVLPAAAVAHADQLRAGGGPGAEPRATGVPSRPAIAFAVEAEQARRAVVDEQPAPAAVLRGHAVGDVAHQHVECGARLRRQGLRAHVGGDVERDAGQPQRAPAIVIVGAAEQAHDARAAGDSAADLARAPRRHRLDERGEHPRAVVAVQALPGVGERNRLVAQAEVRPRPRVDPQRALGQRALPGADAGGGHRRAPIEAVRRLVRVAVARAPVVALAPARFAVDEQTQDAVDTSVGAVPRLAARGDAVDESLGAPARVHVVEQRRQPRVTGGAQQRPGGRAHLRASAQQRRQPPIDQPQPMVAPARPRARRRQRHQPRQQLCRLARSSAELRRAPSVIGSRLHGDEGRAMQAPSHLRARDPRQAAAGGARAILMV